MFKRVKSTILYERPFLKVWEDEVIRDRDGKQITITMANHRDGAQAVVLNGKKEMLLVRYYAYAVGEYQEGLPGGGVDDGEHPLEAAKRELEEESGAKAENWKNLGDIELAPMFSTEKSTHFLATDITSEGDDREDEDNVVGYRWVPFKEAVDMVMDGRIKHANSVIAILKAARILGV